MAGVVILNVVKDLNLLETLDASLRSEWTIREQATFASASYNNVFRIIPSPPWGRGGG
jgi:hypothetical protein